MSARFGVFVPQGWKMDLVHIKDPVEAWEAMTNVARAADAGSWDSIWLFDHFHTVPEATENFTFECWTATTALARDTTRVNVGQMVGCNGYRNPALYAKISSTVDVASHGRLYAGIGAGWYQEEWKAYGYEWPETRDRMRAFREAVQVINKMWTENAPQFSGEYYSIDKPYNEPKGVRKPHPSLWIGGGGEQVTLKLVAQYADACNVGGGNPETITQKLGVLKGHCDKLGRDYDSIIKSTSLNVFPIEAGEDPDTATEKARGGVPFEQFANGTIIGTTAEIADATEKALGAGADYIIYYVPGVAYDLELLTTVEDTIKQYA
ncbi:MAG TPA: LLM class F420-dependent oxidoreductase [Actinopolymorphaceae bacterium]|jgi:F420-dependent oxidoreductase-like protein